MNIEYFNKLDHTNTTGIFIKNDEIEERVCETKHFVFLKHKGNNKIFVETGTHLGGGIANAFAVGFETMHSIEIMEEHHTYAKNRWKDKKNVNLYFGPTMNIIDEVLNQISEPSFFWLDAHFHDSSATYAELEKIKRHSIKTHTILVDDISLYFDKTQIEMALLDINSNYIISYEPTWRSSTDILVAKLP